MAVFAMIMKSVMNLDRGIALFTQIVIMCTLIVKQRGPTVATIDS